MAEDLAKAIVQASSMMEKKEKTLPISVLFHNQGYIVLNPPLRNSKGKIIGGNCAISAYNQASERGLIPLDMAHPAAQMMSRTFDINPKHEYDTLIGVFMNPS